MVRIINTGFPMSDHVATRILREEWEIRPRLHEMALDKDKLLNIRTLAVGASADATPFFPANAPGTFSYHYGTFGLRHEFVGDVWLKDTSNGVETIKNEALHIKIVFANVDVACDNAHEPRPRSNKGAGAERLCAGNDLFGGLPRYVKASDSSEGGWTVYYLMVAPNGAAELSLPVVKGGTFQKFIERIYLSDGRDMDGEPKLSLDEGDVATDFDPKVSRKK